MRSVSVLLIALSASTALSQASNPASSATADEFLREGIAAQQLGKNKAAIEDYRKALGLHPQMAEARANLGAALAADGQFDAAIDEDKRALAAAPSQTAVRMN